MAARHTCGTPRRRACHACDRMGREHVNIIRYPSPNRLGIARPGMIVGRVTDPTTGGK